MSKKKKETIEMTNVMRVLKQEKVNFIPHEYDAEKYVSAEDVAKALSEEPERVFKTLVTTSKSLEHYVFVLPGNKELDLKKGAQAAGEKYVEMLPQKDLLPLTGYIHGGCSPIGMKKKFRTFIDKSALSFETIFVSGGKRGYQVEVNPNDLAKVTDSTFEDITTDKKEN